MNTKAWSLVGGLSATLGTTLLADTLRPVHAGVLHSDDHEAHDIHDIHDIHDVHDIHHDHDEWQLEMMHDEDLFDGTQEDDCDTEQPKVLELDVHIRPTGSVNFAALSLFMDENSEEINPAAATNELMNGAGFLEKNLSDFFDIQIFSTVYFGSKHEPHQLIFDTGSSWLWVQTPECSTCATTNDFKYKESTSYKRGFNQLSQVSYGSGHIWGYRSTDKVCLSAKNDQCVDAMDFIATTNQKGLSGMTSDGIVGLAPVARGTGASLFIEELYNKGKIDQNLFAFAIGKDFEKSKVMIGGFNLKAHSQGGIIWHDLFDTNYWTLPMSDVAYGDVGFPVKVDQLIVDTGTSLTLIPSQDFNTLVKIITKENPKMDFYKLKNGLSASMCSRDDYNSFEDISFRVDNITYQLPVSAYVQYSAGQCQLRLMNAPNVGHWILGLNFFHSYYTVFDAGRKRVGFARSLHSQGSDVRKLQNQEKYFETQFRSMLRTKKAEMIVEEESGRNLLIFIPLGLLLGFITTCCLLKYCKRSQVPDIQLRGVADQENNADPFSYNLLSPKPSEHATPTPVVALPDKSVHESVEDVSMLSQGASRLLNRDSYDSGGSAFRGHSSLPILQQQMQKQYKSPLDSGQFPSI